MKISAIVPVYNGERHLAETLDSVFAQTHPADEVIAVDDGSTDGSGEILRRYGARITVVRQANQGVAGARNAGLAHARGDVIAFIDQDDLWPPGRNRAMAEALASAPGVEVVAGLVEVLNEMTVPRAVPQVMDTMHKEVLVGSLLVRRSVFDRLGGFSARVGYGDDTDFYLRRREAEVPTLRIPVVTLVYRYHDHNTSVDNAVTRQSLLAVFHESLKRRREGSS